MTREFLSSLDARRSTLAFGFALLALAPPRLLPAQERGAVALGEVVEGLGVNTRVLMIAAHPDDEDTQLITWLARGAHVETAYLSLTRGDGGQNLIGNELGEALGAIRTEELLAARRLDGGHQFFTRAFDFGFSKNAEETFAHWPRDSVLRDVVTVIRSFRPHVIVAVFSGTPRDGHGHHQVSAILAREAYDAAGDAGRFPATRTAGLPPWTPLKFYRATRFSPEETSFGVNVGEYDPLLGRSYGELASLSRSQHRSQAMGQLERKGVQMTMVRREATRVGPASQRERSMFEGIDTTWARFRPALHDATALAALDSLPAAIAQAQKTVNLFAPNESVAPLGRVETLLDRVQHAARDAGTGEVAEDLRRSVEETERRVNRALVLASAVAVEATATRAVWPVREPIPIAVRVYNRGKQPITLAAVLPESDAPTDTKPVGVGTTIAPDSAATVAVLTGLSRVTQPWWLVTPRLGDLFTPEIKGIEEDRRLPDAAVRVSFSVGGAPVTVQAPVVYRFADPARGEVDEPLAAAPKISVTVDRAVEYAPANTPIDRMVRVSLRSAAGDTVRDVRVSLALPKGLTADSATRSTMLPPDAIRTVSFRVRGRLTPGRDSIVATAEQGGARYRSGYTLIDYEHIRPIRLYRDATLALQAVDVLLPPRAHIAYIPGVGDNSAPALAALGVPVTVVNPADLPNIDLSTFTAVVVGTRAYESSPELVANNFRLLDYVKSGGTMVVQYGQYEMQRPGIMPYPITLARPADRVTDESAPVRVLDSASPLLTFPNKITQADFAGWVQDRTYYMPRTFDPHYKPLLSTNDPGEPANDAAILVAPYGRGTYVYTTLAFFRQLPVGVPGAARLFVNLVAAGHKAVAQ